MTSTPNTYTAGSFTVTETPDGKWTVAGPADFMDSEDYRRATEAVDDPSGSFAVMLRVSQAPLPMTFAVYLQTKYAGWKGMVQFLKAVKS